MTIMLWILPDVDKKPTGKEHFRIMNWVMWGKDDGFDGKKFFSIRENPKKRIKKFDTFELAKDAVVEQLNKARGKYGFCSAGFPTICIEKYKGNTRLKRFSAYRYKFNHLKDDFEIIDEFNDKPTE